MRNSETTTEMLFGTFSLKTKAPQYAGQLQGIAIDMACKVLLHAQSKLKSLPEDSPAFPLYSWLVNDVQLFVDKFHARNHLDTDKFCVENCQPSLYPELATDTNSEACEQLFRWWSRFKIMVNSMGLNKATFFMEEMRELHNERTLYADCMSAQYMPATRLAEVRAAFGMAAQADSSASREELAALLLRGECSWSKELLAQHRHKAGGHWRELHKGSGRAAVVSSGKARMKRARDSEPSSVP